MQICSEKNGAALTVRVSGELDIHTAPELADYVAANLGDAAALTLDFKDLRYISSAGIRSVLKAAKAMKGRGPFSVVEVCPFVAEVFSTAGLDTVLDIHKSL